MGQICGCNTERKDQLAHNNNDLQPFKNGISSISPTFIQSLSVDDNRNIKKLYIIMDLKRKKVTLDSLIQEIERAYK